MGCRISEALVLEVEDIDFEQGTLTIQCLKARLKLACSNCSARLGRSHAFCPNCGVRVEKAAAQSREHRWLRTLYLDQELHPRGGPVTRSGERLIFGINRHRAWQMIRECARKAGLPNLVDPETGRVHGVSPHHLRDFLRCYGCPAGRFHRRRENAPGVAGPRQYRDDDALPEGSRPGTQGAVPKAVEQEGDGQWLNL